MAKNEAVNMDDPVVLTAAKEALDKAQTKSDVVNVWKQFYLKIGHKRLGRLLLGLSPERE